MEFSVKYSKKKNVGSKDSGGVESTPDTAG